MPKLANRVKVATSTTGTGTVTLGAAETGFQTFAQGGIVDGDIVRYLIEDGSAWEVGQGTYTASGTTLSRTVLESSNSDTALNLTGAAKVTIAGAREDIETPDLKEYSAAATFPAAPPVGAGARAFSLLRGGRTSLAFIPPRGPAQELLGAAPLVKGLLSFGHTTNNSSGILTVGFGNLSLVGTAVARAVATTNIFTQTKRAGTTIASAATNLGSGYTGPQVSFTGDAAGKGGFFFLWRGGFTTLTAGNRFFAGLNNSLSMLNTTGDPSASLNIIGVGKDAADTAFQFMVNDGTGTATKTSTGITVTQAILYEVRVFCAPFGTTVYISLEDLTNGVKAEHSASSDLPSNTTLLFAAVKANSGTQTTGAALDHAAFALETLSQSI